MILQATFPTLDAAASFFNAPANASLRLVSVLPPAHAHLAPIYTALYEERDPVEEARRELLEGRILALVQLDDERKQGHNFPEAVIADGLSVPLATVNNRLSQLAAFRDLDLAARARWIRSNVASIGCVLIAPDEAKARYGCRVELVRLKE